MISPSGVLSYAQLDQAASAVAQALREAGAAPDQVVGVPLPNGPELVSALLGVMRAGDSYLPLDPVGPVARTRRILDGTCVAALVGPPEVRDRLSPHTVAVDPAQLASGGSPVCWSAAGPSVLPGAGTGPQDGQPASAGRLVYIYYTSGSTGEPKGAGMPMEPLINLLRWEVDRMRQRESARGVTGAARRQRRVLHFARPTFDVSFQEIFATLVAGDCLVTVDEGRRSDPQYLIGLMREHGVERAYLPPMVLAQLASSGLGLGTPLRLWELVIAGGSLRLTAEIRQFLGTLPAPVLDDQYGMTEVHTVMARMLTGAPSAWPATVTFTDLVDNVAVTLLDESGQPAGNGEICAQGACVGRGYLGRPGLTASRFIPDPAGEPGVRMYRTGDVGLRLPDGSIEVKGRLDDQLKLRGHRITIGEVEHALLSLPGVARVSVLNEGIEEHQRLVAYVVPEEHGSRLTPDDMRMQLRDALPSYMIPDFFVLLEDMPLNRHGKVNRSRLRHWRSAGVNEARMTPVQAAIARIWATALGAWIEGPEVHFFRCGGNSVLATTVTAQIRQYFARELSFEAIFRYPVLADLAKVVSDVPTSDEPVIVPVPAGDDVPATSAQLGLWFDYQVRTDPYAYNVAWAARLVGPVQPGALGVAVEQLTRRHSALRTVFREEADSGGEHPVAQHVLADCPEGYFNVVDVSDAGELAGLVEAYRSAPFDLHNGPLHRTYLIRVAPADAVLLFTGHHIILDAWSEDLIRRYLGELYTAQVTGQAPKLPPVTVEFRDYAQWRSRRTGSAPLARQADYWRARLRDAPAELLLPLLAPRQAAADSTGAATPVRLSAPLTGALRALAVQEGVTPLVVMLSVFGLALTQVLGTGDLVVGIAASGRSRAGLEHSVGFFVNSLPVHMNLAAAGAGVSAGSLREILAEVRSAVLGAYANQDVPFDQIVRTVAPPRSLGRHPLFQVWFAFDDQPARLEMNGITVSPADLPVSRVPMDLALHVRHDAGAILGEVTYRTSLLSGKTVGRIARAFENTAAEVAGCDLAAAPSAERR